MKKANDRRYNQLPYVKELVKEYRRRFVQSGGRKREWQRIMADPVRRLKSRTYWAKYQRDLQDRVIEMYGNCCACCGETINEFLEIDHINNDGAQHRKTINRTRFLHWLLKERRDGFQILCSNCNMAKGRYGRCPHAPG